MTTTDFARAAGLACACATLAVAPVAVADLESPDLEALARTLDAARLTLDVPGMGVAIVHDGEVVFARGFGERTLGGGEDVDEHTIFAIGSSSKAFTAAAVAMLVDSGDAGWNDRVTKHLPWLRLHDPYPTSELTIIDMLSHRNGLPRGDMLWYGSGMERKEILERLPHLEPNSSFRSQFGYQNIMYLAAGQMLEEVSGVTWDDWVQTRIFDPLGMDESTTTITALPESGNIATPHAKVDDELVTVAWRNIDNAAPAGSINSSVSDMAKWVTLLLNEGRVGAGDDEQMILTPGSIDVMWTPFTLATATGPAGALRAESHFLLYGLGWFIQDYRGERIIQHGGNIDGMSALVAMIPEEELGVVVLTNMNGTVLPNVAVNEVFDAYLGVDDHDWADEAKQVLDTAEAMGKQTIEQLEARRIEGTSPTLPLEEYTGTYRHQFYGDIVVTLEDGALVFTRGDLVGEASHWHYDTFEVENRAKHPPLGNVTFTIGGDGKVAEFSGFSSDEWMRVADKPTADASIELTEADLRRYTGTYVHEGLGIQLNIFIQEGELRSQLPGQPSFVLLATGEHTFTVSGLPAEITVELVFAFDDAGAVETLSLTQTPGGTFELVPKAE
jgi:CubicO group peptidase (beta-lactamase class C family)